MQLTIEGHPTPAEALELYRAVFPTPGDYVVERSRDVVKAGPGGSVAEDFEEWFLDALFNAARTHYRSSREAIWAALDRLLDLRGAVVPSELDFDELSEAFFDLSTASTARMVGLNVPRDMLRRLESIGFTPREALDFPALAYRLGLIYRDLAATTSPVPVERLLADARSIPLTPAEEAAAEYARRRAGIWMRPIFDRTGTLWSADRELFPVRSHVSGAISRRIGSREAARQLQNTYRALEIDRDAERVVRTEIAEASNRGAWAHEAKSWGPDSLIFRQTSRNACKGCLRLYLQPNGMPRLYAPRVVDEATAGGPNTGSWREWRPMIGATHPNCFPADTLVSVLGDGPTRAYERFYRGDLVVISTDTGECVRSTPNHPILVVVEGSAGWLPAWQITEGMGVVRAPWPRGAGEPIEDVVRRMRSDATSEFIDVGPDDFHGDGAGSGAALVWHGRNAPPPSTAHANPTAIVEGSHGEVTVTAVVRVERQPFTGTVYNLETPHHFYGADGLIVHNCVCGPWQRWMDRMTSIFARTAEAKAGQLRALKVFDEED